MSATVPQSATAASARVSPRTVAVAVAGMLGAWVAAGSVGPLVDPLRHLLTWLALGTAVVLDWPSADRSVRDWLLLAGALLAGVLLNLPAEPAMNVLGVAVVLAVLVRSPDTLRGRIILRVALAVTVLGVYRAAYASIPAVWLAANRLGWLLGVAAGSAVERPLDVGATFGGVDFLVLMAAWYAGWLASTRTPRAPRAITAAAAILLVHLVYLATVGLAGDMLAALPEVRPPDIPEPGTNHVGTFTWSAAAAGLIPWNLPALAAVLHAVVVLAMVGWSDWNAAPRPDPAQPKPEQEDLSGRALAADLLAGFGPVVLAVLLPVATVLSLTPSDLADVRVVVYDPGNLDWGKPQFDSDTGGMYGMLPDLVVSLGATLTRSADLGADDLAAADVVVLLHPAEPLPDDRLARLLGWVREDGGSLLVVSDAQAVGGPLRGGLPAVLDATSIRLRHDVVVPAAPRWDATQDGLRHPATTGLGDQQNRLGLYVGSSLATRTPAQPIATVRFALGEPGSHAARTGHTLYDADEPLGDLVLAAEQRIGRGRLAVLGSNTCLHNDMIARAYPFVARLLAGLARPASGARAWWRQAVGILAALGLIGLVAWRPTAGRIGAAAVALGVAWAACAVADDAAARVVPEGRATSSHPIAYIDASHLEAYSRDASHDLGLNGLERTLVRAGYLPLYLPKVTAERLEAAAMLVSIAPARDFSADERKTVAAFVEQGGVLIAMAGAEHARATNGLVEQFGFRVPPSPLGPQVVTPEPRPEGVFFSRYLVLDDYEPAMWHHAAWPVESTGSNTDVLKRDLAGKATIVARAVGNGAVIVIGDTYFATNQNLEWGPRSSTTENITFWRWMLARTVGPEPWLPSKPAAEEPPAEQPPAEQPPAEEPPADEESPSDEQVSPVEKMPDRPFPDAVLAEPPPGESRAKDNPTAAREENPVRDLPVEETPAAIPLPEVTP